MNEPVTSPHRLTDVIQQMLDAELEAQMGDAEFTYDLSLIIGPGSAPGVVVPQLLVVAWMPGVVLGSFVHTIAIMQNPEAISEAQMPDIVRNIIDGLNDARSRQLEAHNVTPMPGGPNGQGT